MTLTCVQEKTFQILKKRSFFKLICGGSFSDTNRLKELITAYTKASVAAIDVSASLAVTEAAIEALSVSTSENGPLLMVSFPLDSDPHFRKIELKEEACISCGACLPVCPTDVFSFAAEPLAVDTPACYGCGRCVPACPTDALHLDPFSVMTDLDAVLRKPQVQAVEIHSSFCDAEMIELLYRDVGHLLSNKIISVCFCLDVVPLEKALTFVNALKAKTSFPLIVQVDGVPMSGSDDPNASSAALESAKKLSPLLPPDCYVTVSGGVNGQTLQHLKENRYPSISGIGMGTYARKWVWDKLDEPDTAAMLAKTLISSFVTTQVPQLA